MTIVRLLICCLGFWSCTLERQHQNDLNAETTRLETEVQVKKTMLQDSTVARANSEMQADDFAPQQDSTALKSKANLLRSLYSKMRENPDDQEIEEQFFEAFPDSFESFNKLYGYGKQSHILTYQAEQHLPAFFNLDSIGLEAYFKKLINVAIGGRWEADAVNIFKRGLREKSFEKPELLFQLLSQRSDEKIKSFFVFFFDGPHPKKSTPTEFQPFEESKVYGIMLEAHQEVLKYWENE